MAAFIIPSIFTAVNKFSSPVKGMARDVDKFANSAQSAIKRVDKGMNKLFNVIGETGKQMLSFASAAVIAGGIISGISFSYQAIKDYDKAVGSLLAVTGLTKDQFKPFGVEIASVAAITKESSIDVARAFETIGSANSALLESSDAMGKMAKSAITLAQAAGDDLQPTAANLVSVMNQFSLGAESADRAMNVLAAGTKVGAATIPQIAESMKNFGAVAAGANISIEQSVALVEVLGKKSIFGGEAGNKLKGSLLLLQKAGVGYKSGLFNINDALTEAKAKIDKLRTAKEKDAAITKMFGAENVVTGKILLENIDLFEKWTGEVTGTSEATIQAAKNNDTLSKALDQLSASWINIITGSSNVSSGLESVKKIVQSLATNLDTVLLVVVSLVGAFLAWKTIVLATTIVTTAYNIAIGVYNALFTTSLVLTNKNAVAQAAYAITSKIAYGALTLFAGAQWLLNAAMTANPIGLIIVAIAALIALVVVIIKYWNDWGAAMSIILGPIGIIISLVQSFRRNWDMITKAFSEGGILAGLKAIGVTILDAILMPMQQLLELVAKITGLDIAAEGAKKIAAFRKELGVNVETDEEGDKIDKKEVINIEEQKQAAAAERMQTNNARVQLDINDPNGRVTPKTNSNLVEVKTSSTMEYKGL